MFWFLNVFPWCLNAFTSFIMCSCCSLCFSCLLMYFYVFDVRLSVSVLLFQCFVSSICIIFFCFLIFFVLFVLAFMSLSSLFFLTPSRYISSSFALLFLCVCCFVSLVFVLSHDRLLFCLSLQFVVSTFLFFAVCFCFCSLFLFFLWFVIFAFSSFFI